MRADDTLLHWHSDAALAIRCPFCGAEPGYLCATFVSFDEDLRTSAWAHASRDEAAAAPDPLPQEPK